MGNMVCARPQPSAAGSGHTRNERRSMFSKKVILSVLLVMALTSCIRSAASYVARGNKYFAQGKYDDAVLQYRNAIKKDPKYAEAYYRMALTGLRQNHFTAAYQLLKRA